jgi:hypothetical protein
LQEATLVLATIVKHFSFQLKPGHAVSPIPNNKRSTGNAKRFPMTGNREDQADAGLLQHVVEGVYPAVAAAIRNGKRHVVESSHETRAISLWREIDRAEPIVRANDDKWRRCDKSPTMAASLCRTLLVNHLFAGPTCLLSSVSVLITSRNRASAAAASLASVSTGVSSIEGRDDVPSLVPTLSYGAGAARVQRVATL